MRWERRGGSEAGVGTGPDGCAGPRPAARGCRPGSAASAVVPELRQQGGGRDAAEHDHRPDGHGRTGQAVRQCCDERAAEGEEQPAQSRAHQVGAPSPCRMRAAPHGRRAPQDSGCGQRPADRARTQAEDVVAGGADRGVVVCGTGIGVSIAANKVRGAYCACVADVYQAQRATLSNNANLIAMGSQVLGIETAKVLLENYLANEFDPASRSGVKVARICEYEAEH